MPSACVSLHSVPSTSVNIGQCAVSICEPAQSAVSCFFSTPVAFRVDICLLIVREEQGFECHLMTRKVRLWIRLCMTTASQELEKEH